MRFWLLENELESKKNWKGLGTKQSYFVYFEVIFGKYCGANDGGKKKKKKSRKMAGASADI